MKVAHFPVVRKKRVVKKRTMEKIKRKLRRVNRHKKSLKRKMVKQKFDSNKF